MCLTMYLSCPDYLAQHSHFFPMKTKESYAVFSSDLPLSLSPSVKEDIERMLSLYCEMFTRFNVQKAFYFSHIAQTEISSNKCMCLDRCLQTNSH